MASPATQRAKVLIVDDVRGNLLAVAAVLETDHDLLLANSGFDALKILEQGLRERVAKARRERWLEENADAIAEHNERVAGRGVFSDRLRRF